MSTAIVWFIFMMSIHNAGYGEYIFRKDGAIIKGSIVRDDVATISVRREDKAVININRNDVLRIIYTDIYLGKVFVRLTSGEIFEGFQIDEDRDNYYFRRDISKPEEIVLPRQKVMFISRTNPTDVKGAPSTVSIEVSWSPPFKPAKKYKVYVRDVMGKQEKFRMEGETGDVSYSLNNLQKSWTYEIYATAIASTGEESLPSEKITVNTLPDPPEKLTITDIPAPGGKTATLIFNWVTVSDPSSRVKSYAIYETVGGRRVKKGTSLNGEFVIKDFPAEGRHRFSVVSVNDINTESDEARGIYDAGYKIYLRGMFSYIKPLGVMGEMATSGYGMVFDAGLSAKRFSLGVEIGYSLFNYTEDISSMTMIPLLLEFDCRIPLTLSFSLRPVIKAGWSSDTIEYVVHDVTDPLITATSSKSNFDPMAAAGAYIQYEIIDRVDVFTGAEYSMIFQEKGRMNFISISFGGSYTF